MKDKVVTITSSNGGILSNIFDLKSVTIFQGKVRVQIPVSHETLLNDQNMRNISVKVPLFKSTVLASGKHSFTFHMSHDSYDGIE